MRGTAHAIIGGSAGALLAAAIHQPVLPLALCGAGAGLLPDIDHPYSALGRYVPWPTATGPENHRTGFVAHGRRWFGGRTVWHRGETHSVGAAAIAGAAAGGITVGVSAWVRAHAGAGILAVLARAGLHPHPWAAGASVAAAVLSGYVSHLVADTANRSPQMLWWPMRRRLVHAPWKGVKEASTAGHLVEVAAAGLAALAAVAMLAH